MNTSPSLSPPGSDLDGLVESLEKWARVEASEDAFVERPEDTLYFKAASAIRTLRALRERVEGERDEWKVKAQAVWTERNQVLRDAGSDEIGLLAQISQLEAELKRRDEALRLLASIWFYGEFRAETRNERRLAEIMESLGLWPLRSEADLIAALDRTQPPELRRPYRLPARDLTDAELVAEHGRVEKLWDEMFEPDEDGEVFEGHGGSPGEWMVERMDEIATEQARRAQPQEGGDA